MSQKVKYPRAVALDVARDLCRAIAPGCHLWPDGTPALKVCGSLRRGKSEVGDIELVYIPRLDQVPEAPDLLGSTGRTLPVNRVDALLDRLIADVILAPRLNKLGRISWGLENKLAVHVPSGVPVDLFSTDLLAWHSYVVCRTGSAESNTKIATTAMRRGWRWHPTRGYFSDAVGQKHWIRSEEDVFRLVGLPYLEPRDR